MGRILKTAVVLLTVQLYQISAIVENKFYKMTDLRTVMECSRSKKKKLKYLLKEVRLIVDEAVTLDGKSNAKDAIKAYTEAIELLDYAITFYCEEIANKQMLQRKVIDYVTRREQLKEEVVDDDVQQPDEEVSLSKNQSESQKPKGVCSNNEDREVQVETEEKEKPRMVLKLKKNGQAVAVVEEEEESNSNNEDREVQVGTEKKERWRMKLKTTGEAVAVLDEEEEPLRTIVEAMILTEVETVKWSDVIGLDEIKESLHESLTFPIWYKRFCTEDRILLYGFPGTGKTLLGKAIATEAIALGYTVFSVKGSDLNSQWLAEGAHLVKELFKLAKEKKPSVVILDDDDGLFNRSCPIRTSTLRQSMKEREIDGVCVIGITNQPWKIDVHLLGRFNRVRYVGLPNTNDRFKFFKHFLSGTTNTVLERDLWFLAKSARNYTSEEIQWVVERAQSEPFERTMKAKHFRQVQNGLTWAPCTASDQGAQKMSLYDLWSKGRKVLLPPIDLRDVVKVLRKLYPIENDDKMLEFHKRFGYGEYF